MTKARNTLGNGKLANGEEIKFPKHLTPEIIHSALFIGNANNMETASERMAYCSKQIGDEAMSYAMALLILPTLMELTKDSKEFKDFKEQRKKKPH
jgi:hypothetical protein